MESNTEVTIRFEISNIRTALETNTNIFFQDQGQHFSCSIKCLNVTCYIMHTCNAHAVNLYQYTELVPTKR